MREILENQQEITTLTVIWARQLVSPQPKLGPISSLEIFENQLKNDRVELIDAGSLRYGTGPSQLRLRANKLPSPNHCESRDFLLVNENLSLRKEEQKRRNKNLLDTELTQTESQREESGESQFQGSLWRATLCAVVQKERHGSQSGVFRPSLISPRRLPMVVSVRLESQTKRRRWRRRAGDRGKTRTDDRPFSFTNRKAAPGKHSNSAHVGHPIHLAARRGSGPRPRSLPLGA